MSTDAAELQVEVRLDAGADAGELEQETLRLREQLLELDVASVERPSGGPVPEGTRGPEAVLLATLVVEVGKELVGAVVRAVAGWVGQRRDRGVKLTLGGESIELSDVGDETQRALLEAFLARHAGQTG